VVKELFFFGEMQTSKLVLRVRKLSCEL